MKSNKEIDWNLVPEGYSIGFSTSDLPIWLKIAVQIPPMRWHAIYSVQKRGFASYTPPLDSDSKERLQPINFDDPNWRDPDTGKSVQDMLDEGSLAFLKPKKPRLHFGSK